MSGQEAFGHYRLLEKLGAGGMGEVWRAHDTRLGRDVAVKILPEDFASNPERLARFRREARLLATLNHPNVAAIHELGESAGVHYLVMELIPGATLPRQRPLEQALGLARQLALALEAAHEKSIIHRDLKPQNVLVTPSDVVKVVDFGLAKSIDAGGDDSGSLTASAVTEHGTIMGTAPYMSPEQARGGPLDRRADIWGFGCLLYELLTGRRAFEAATFSDTIAAVLTREPDWSALPARTPVRIRELTRRCLQKDPDRRLRDAGDARIEIEDALAELREGGARAGKTASPGRPAAVLAALVAAALLAGAGGWYAHGRARAPTDQGAIRLHQLTDFVGLEEYPAISPDGKAVAFVAAVDGLRQIWVRLLGGGAPLQLTRDPVDHSFPRWSPDSTSLVYYSPSDEGGTQGFLWEVPALGGAPRRLVASLGAGDVSHDGQRLAYFHSAAETLELRVAGRDGSHPRTVAGLEARFGHAFPRFSPDDRRIAFQRGQVFDYELLVVDVDGGEPRTVVSDGGLLSGFTWSPDGSGLVYSSSKGSSVLYLPNFDLWSAELRGGTARKLTFGDASYIHPDLVEERKLVATRTTLRFDIWRIPVDGTPSENVRRAVPVTRQTAQVQTPSVGPGDREIVYLSDSGGHGNLWIMKLDGSRQARQITFDMAPDSYMGVPLWSPDGRHIAYVIRQAGSWLADMWIIRPDGTSPRKIDDSAGWAVWSSDGRWLYYGVSKRNVWELRRARVDGGTAERVRAESVQSPALSADGRTLYYLAPLGNVNGVSNIEVRAAALPDGPSRLLARIPAWRIAAWQILHPVVSPDDRWLAVPLTDGPTTNLWAVSTANGQLRPLTDFGREPTFIVRRVSWSADGRFVYAAVGHGDADVVLLSRSIPPS
jgi:Tol biopolymer transport system component